MNSLNCTSLDFSSLCYIYMQVTPLEFIIAPYVLEQQLAGTRHLGKER